MDEKSRIDDIVSMLDDMFAKGHGHVDVTVDPEQEGEKMVETMGCLDCSKHPMACSVPTLQDGSEEETE